jgi:transposase
MGKPRKKYTQEFKRDAVRMMQSRGTRTIAEVADDLGVAPNLLHRWASKVEREAVSKRNAEGETLEQEVRRLRKEVESLRLDKAILKKAAAFFVLPRPLFDGRWIRLDEGTPRPA